MSHSKKVTMESFAAHSSKVISNNVYYNMQKTVHGNVLGMLLNVTIFRENYYVSSVTTDS